MRQAEIVMEDFLGPYKSCPCDSLVIVKFLPLDYVLTSQLGNVRSDFVIT